MFMKMINKKTCFLILFCLSLCPCFAAEKALLIEKDAFFTEEKVIKEHKIVLSKEKWHEGLFIDGSNIWINNGKGFNTDVIDIASGKKVSEIEVPITFMEGIDRISKDNYVWSDWDSATLFFGRLKKNRLVPKKRVRLRGLFPAGLVFAQEKLYVITWDIGIFFRRYYLLVLDKEGYLLKKIRIKDIRQPSQIAWDGDFLWITSWKDEKVYKLDIKDHKLKSFFRTGINMTTGIVWDKDRFWVTGTYEDLYSFKII